MRKFLIISTYAPPAISGAPLMMYNVLRYFPQNSFCILTSHFGLTDKAREEGEWLQVPYAYFDHPYNATQLHRESTLFQRMRAWVKRIGPLKSFAMNLGPFYFSAGIVARGKKLIAKERVELLVAYSDMGSAFLGTYLLHKITKKPYYLFLYDLYAGNAFPFLPRLLSYFLEPFLFRDAERIFVMSEALQRHYQEKYGKEAIVIHNAIPIPSAPPVRSTASRHPRIVFAGTIDWPQLQALRNLILALGMIKAPITLSLYTPHNREFLNGRGIFETERVIFASAVPHEMKNIQQSADILFVPLSFRTQYPLLINTSSPGKTYGYLVSGRPILVHAPRESYIARYAKNRGFALVVDEDSPEQLKNAIVRLLQDSDLVERLVRNAWQTAVENHDARKESEKLQRYF